MAGSTPVYGFPYPQGTDLVADYPALGQSLATGVETVAIAKLAYATPTNAQTGTTYTFVLADANKLVTASNASASTYTIPPQSSVVWVANTILRVTNLGAGVVTFAGGVGVTVTNTAATLAQYQSANLIRTASNAWTVLPFSGAGNAVLSNTATGTYSSGGINYAYYQFTSSGTATVTTAGFADVLVVGGGGGGGFGNGGGAGGAGLLISRTYFLETGSYSCTIGGGGAGSSTTSGTDGSPSYIGLVSIAIGGGGGGGGGGATTLTGRSGGCGGGGTGGSTGTSVAGGSAAITGGFAGGSGFHLGGTYIGGGGGGGMTAVGANASTTAAQGGAGGAGFSSSITGSSITYAGGGGGGVHAAGTAGAGGSGGGGAGGALNANGTAGTANSGGGGGGAGNVTYTGGNGGSGIVIIRVKV